MRRTHAVFLPVIFFILCFSCSAGKTNPPAGPAESSPPPSETHKQASGKTAEDEAALYADPEAVSKLEKAQKMMTCTTMESLKTEAEIYYLDTRTCPSMEALKDQLKSKPLDAWEQEFMSECTADDEFEIFSAGPDKTFGTGDDLDEKKCTEINAD